MLIGAAMLLGGFAAAPQEGQQGVSARSECATVQRALADSLRVKPGVMRKDVEKYFKYDGGAQFLPGNAHYVWTGCSYLKLDVEYEPPPDRAWDLTSRRDPTLPEDRVQKVSKLYVEFPAMD